MWFYDLKINIVDLVTGLRPLSTDTPQLGLQELYCVIGNDKQPRPLDAATPQLVFYILVLYIRNCA